MCIGGPALVYYVTPTDEEVFKVCTLSYPTPNPALASFRPFHWSRLNLENNPRHEKEI